MNSNLAHKLGLGTVQFGVSYGITNQSGKTSARMAHTMLEEAAQQGVDLLDTAPSYGNSEQVLGESGQLAAWKIVSKTPHFATDHVSRDTLQLMQETLEHSLSGMGVQQLYGLLVHGPDDLLKPGGDELYAWLKSQQEQGRVSKIGVSVYDADQIRNLCDRFDLDIIQLPCNVLDQRLLEDGTLAQLKSAGIEVHARSLFLQGVLLSGLEQLPAYFSAFRDSLAPYWQAVQDAGLSSLAAALTFGLQQAEIDRVLVGAENIQQLREIIQAARQADTVRMDWADYARQDPALLNPSNWRR